MCRCGVGVDLLEGVQGRAPTALCHGQISPNMAMT